MSQIDKLVGMDDQTPRHERAPLWKRAIWHSLKALVRKHPHAALSALGSGAGYALKRGTVETTEALQETIDNVAQVTLPQGKAELSEREAKELLQSLGPEEKKAIIELAQQKDGTFS